MVVCMCPGCLGQLRKASVRFIVFRVLDALALDICYTWHVVGRGCRDQMNSVSGADLARVWGYDRHSALLCSTKWDFLKGRSEPKQPTS